jgi:hypothetical protein
MNHDDLALRDRPIAALCRLDALGMNRGSTGKVSACDAGQMAAVIEKFRHYGQPARREV